MSAIGDFCQLPGVMTTPLYKTPIKPQAKRGKLVFDTYDSIVVLKQNMRSTDPSWRKILTNARFNRLTEEDIKTLNTRVVNQNLLPPEGTTITFTENVDREEYNLNVATEKIATNRKNSTSIDYDSGFTIIGDFVTMPRKCSDGMVQTTHNHATKLILTC